MQRLSLVLWWCSVGLASANLVHLSEETFDKSIRSKKAMVKFTSEASDWEHEVKPEWDKLAEHYKNHHGILIAEVDCDKSEEYCKEKFEIEHCTSISVLFASIVASGGQQLFFLFREMISSTLSHFLLPNCLYTHTKFYQKSLPSCTLWIIPRANTTLEENLMT